MRTALHALLLACVAAALAAGCTRTRVHAEQPALLVDAEDLAVVQAALRGALGRPVVLAADAFTRESTLFIEQVPARVDGQRIDGRITQSPERFTLLAVDRRCVLLRESTGERLALAGARCRAAALSR